jgi:hypothetical protein
MYFFIIQCTIYIFTSLLALIDLSSYTHLYIANLGIKTRMYAGCSGQVMYVRGLQKVNRVYVGCNEGTSHMYAGCSKVNCVYVLYKGFWAGAGPYRLMSAIVQVMSIGCIGGLQHICGKRKFQGFVEVWFSDFYGYWRTRLSSNFGEFVLAGRVGFALIISEIKRLQNIKFVSHVY